ncbi:hypothetical protein Q7P37_011305 [Cladosporium fusiforme]
MDASTTVNSQPPSKTEELLRAEIAALKAEVATLRSSQALLVEPSSTTSSCTFNFLGLPRELRNAVYDECVAVGEVRVSYPGHIKYDDMRFGTPSGSATVERQLFLVNRQVCREAVERYQIRNDFIIPTMSPIMFRDVVVKPPDRTNKLTNLGIVPKICDLMPYCVRSISIPIDVRQWTGMPSGLYEWWIYYQTDFNGDVRRRSCHDEAEESFSEEAAHLIKMVLKEFPQLRNLQIYVQNAYCPANCHRLISNIIGSGPVMDVWHDMSADRSNYPLETLDFLGTVDKEERECIRFGVPDTLQDCITFHGAIDQESGLWDPTVEIHDTPPDAKRFNNFDSDGEMRHGFEG